MTITDKRYRGPSPEKTPEISAERNATKDSRGGGERSPSPLTKSLVCMSVCTSLTIYSSCGSAEWLQWQLCHYTSIYQCNSPLKWTIFLNQLSLCVVSLMNSKAVPKYNKSFLSNTLQQLCISMIFTFHLFIRLFQKMHVACALWSLFLCAIEKIIPP
jgi:hypothetical protein